MNVSKRFDDPEDARADAAERGEGPADGTRGEADERRPSLAEEGLPGRADELVGRLTTQEKIAMLHQWSPGVPRLGIAPWHTGTEALHGVAWHGVATVFPQAVGLGATWDPDLVREVGAAVGEQVRALHRRDPAVSLNVWAPVVNLLRDPRWGRNEEGYSEDPLLTARTAVAYCAGLRGDHPVYWRTAPVLKHFLAYNHETGRDTTSASVRARVLHEYELPPFLAPIEAGLALGVMPSYNLVNGRPNHVSPHLNQLLRSAAPGELIVCSDAHAPSNLVDTEHYFDDHAVSHAAALRAGVDSFTDHDTDASVTVGRITEALRRGLITVADVDRAVRRLLLTRLRLGEFDPGLDPYAAPPGSALPGSAPPGSAPSGSALDPGAYRDLARRAAGEAVVVLRNDGGLLPLVPWGPAGLRVAVVGPLADTVFEDWYSGTMPYQVTVADGLRDALGGTFATVETSAVDVAGGADGASRVDGAGGAGSVGVGGAGGVVAVEDGADRVELSAGPDRLGEFDVFEWGSGTGGERVVTLRAVATGRYLTVASDGTVTAGADRPDGWVVHETFAVEPAPGPDGLVRLRSEAASRYVIINRSSGTWSASADAAGAQPLRWRVVTDGAAAVSHAAAGADACVVVVGNHPLINGREAQDRTTLALPAAQQRLVRAALAANPRTVLVIMSSYPYALDTAGGQAPAIVWTCHGGQEAGHGVADVLLGARPPSGRLPQTWYADDGDLPGLLDYDIIGSGRTYLYFTGRPLYPFGHGLPYTTFRYSELRLEPGEVAVAADGTVTAGVDVTNTGSRDGTEVVQVYVRAVAPRRPRPRRALAGFARVTLAPGQTRAVSVPVPVAALAYWDVAAHRMTVDPGEYEIMVGSSSADIAAAARLAVTGPAPGPRLILGTDLAAADFDDAENITLVDASRQDGDAVGPAGPGLGRIVFRDVDLGFLGAPGSVTLRVARAEPGTARAELRLGEAGEGGRPGRSGRDELLAEFTVPSTGDRYAWTEVTAELTVPAGVTAELTVPAGVTVPAAAWGVGDLCLVLDGAQRVAWLRVAAPRGAGGPR